MNEEQTINLYEVLPFYWSEYCMKLMYVLAAEYGVADTVQVLYLNALLAQDSTTIFKLCDKRVMGSMALNTKKVNQLWSAGLLEDKWSRTNDDFPDTLRPSEQLRELFARYTGGERSAFRTYAQYVNDRLYKKVAADDHLDRLGEELLQAYPLTARHSDGGEYSLRSWKLGSELDPPLPMTEDAFLKLYYRNIGYGKVPYEELESNHREVMEKLALLVRERSVMLRHGLAYFIVNRVWRSVKLPKGKGDTTNFGIQL